MNTAQRVVAAVCAVDPRTTYVARALTPGIRTALAAAAPATTELPFVRGSTVVPNSIGVEDLTVVGHPNDLGALDPFPSTGHVLIVVDRGATEEAALPDKAIVVADGRPAPPGSVAAGIADAQYLSRRLRQLPGCRLAFPPQSPAFVMLVPVDPGPLASIGTVLAGRYPELPGGIRIPVPLEMSRQQRSAYAGSLETAVREAIGM